MNTDIERFKNACENGDLVTVTQLFDYVNGNENVNMLEMRNIAARNGNLNILEFFREKGVNINELYNSLCFYENPLMIAAQKGWVDIIDYLLLQPEININLQDNLFGWTALICAAVFGKTDVVDILLQNKDCQINISDSTGSTIIFYATSLKYLQMIDKLIVYGSNIWHINKSGKTLLHVAVMTDNLKVLEKILSFGLDMNQQDNFGFTPLIYAVKINNIEMVKIFLENGVDTRIKDNNGKTVSDYVTNEEIKELLNQYSSSGKN